MLGGADPRVGRVDSFDEARGIGTVVDADSGAPFPFHCTAIADGTRTIAEGTAVVFTMHPGRLGRVEARSVTAIGPSVSAAT